MPAPGYSAYIAPEKYAQMAFILGLGGKTEQDRRERLFARVDELLAEVDEPRTLGDQDLGSLGGGLRVDEFLAHGFQRQRAELERRVRPHRSVGPHHEDQLPVATFIRKQLQGLIRIGRALALDLASGPTLAHAMTKRQLDAEWHVSIETALDMEAEVQAGLMQTNDFKRAYEAFANKRKPEFQGD